MRTRSRFILPLVLLTSTATAQLELEPVDQGVGDTDPLAVSQRDVPHDQRLPASFDRLYKVPNRDDLLMRIDGGVYAVFPRSLYAQTRFGPAPLIPNDTVFHIGPATVAALAAIEDGPEPPPGVERRVDHSAASARQVRRAVNTERVAEATVPRRTAGTPAVTTATIQAGLVTIANDAVYRRERLRTLMRRAIAAQRGRDGS